MVSLQILEAGSAAEQLLDRVVHFGPHLAQVSCAPPCTESDG